MLLLLLMLLLLQSYVDSWAVDGRDVSSVGRLSQTLETDDVL